MEISSFPCNVLVLEGFSRRSELRLRHVWERHSVGRSAVLEAARQGYQLIISGEQIRRGV